MSVSPTGSRSPQDVNAPRHATPAPPPATAPAQRGAAAPASEADRFRAAGRPEERLSQDQSFEAAGRLKEARRAKADVASGVASALAGLGLRFSTHETGHDQFGVAGKPASLEVKLALDGPSYLDPELKGKEVRFLVDGKPVGTAVTDDEGVAHLPFTPPAEGQYKVSYEMARPEDQRRFKDDPTGQATLFVLKDRPTLVFDIDNTLSNLPEWKVPFSGEKADAFKNSVEALNRLSQDYNIVYLTARPDIVDAKTRQFLFKDHDPNKPGTQAFPNGPIFYDDWGLDSYKEASQIDPERNAAYKTEAMKRLQLTGIPLVAGIGNQPTDAAAYKNAGLDSFILDNTREAQHPGEFYQNLQNTLTDPDRLHGYEKKVGEVVEGRNLKDPAAVFQHDMDILTGTRATPGNTVQVYVDGQTARPEFLKALDSAKETITYQSFEFSNDKAGNEVADKLIEKAKQGVKVRVVVDAVGSKDAPPLLQNQLMKKMQAAGIEVRVFNNPLESAQNLKEALHRDHRKAIVIDGGKTAFLGGMNTAEAYLGSGDQPAKYHDVFAQLQGPAARDVQDIFMGTWKAAGGTLSDADAGKLYQHMGPVVENATGSNVRIVNHVPKQDFHIKDAYLRMINEAKDHIYLENSFPMDREIVDALAAAAKRGVRVDYIYGDLSKADPMHPVTENKFPDLLKAGVHIWRYPQFVHTKSLSIDGKVASVGSSNVDNYSLEMDREAVAVVSDPAWTKSYEANLFQKDIAKSTPVPSDPHDPFWRNNFTREALDALWPDFLE
jgi:cardiolipin synthase A/B